MSNTRSQMTCVVSFPRSSGMQTTVCTAIHDITMRF